MSEAEVINLAVSETEVQSISTVAAKIVEEIKNFAEKHGVAIPYDIQKIEEDLIIFLTKRKVVNLRKIRVGILEGGGMIIGDTITGKRRADLIFRIIYKEGGARTP